MEDAEKRKTRWRLAGRALLALIGAALIFVALYRLALFAFGASAPAGIHTHRYGGANGGPGPQRYSWYIDYTFTDKEGHAHSGNTARRGSDIAVKTEHTVYYFPAAPWLNALEGDAEPGLTHLLYLGGGALLLYLPNRKPRPKPNRTAHKPDPS